jgi:hypothetical protein
VAVDVLMSDGAEADEVVVRVRAATGPGEDVVDVDAAPAFVGAVRVLTHHAAAVAAQDELPSRLRDALLVRTASLERCPLQRSTAHDPLSHPRV